MDLNHLFVYGTLKRGFSNHHFLKGARYLGPAMTLERYALYSSDYPLVVKEKAFTRIKGELYLVDHPALKRIDTLEGHPDIYYREKILVELDSLTPANSRIIEAWIYFYPEPEGEFLQDGVFPSSLDKGRDE